VQVPAVPPPMHSDPLAMHMFATQQPPLLQVLAAQQTWPAPPQVGGLEPPAPVIVEPPAPVVDPPVPVVVDPPPPVTVNPPLPVTVDPPPPVTVDPPPPVTVDPPLPPSLEMTLLLPQPTAPAHTVKKMVAAKRARATVDTAFAVQEKTDSPDAFMS
jgi:hypothetical protein